MGINLIVTRAYDRQRNRTGETIPLDEWKSLIEQDPELRLRTDPYATRNPTTGLTIKMQAGEADSEFNRSGEWIPFLRFSRGRLTTGYSDDFLEPDDPSRKKIAQVAKRLSAVITHDAGDEILEW